MKNINRLLKLFIPPIAFKIIHQNRNSAIIDSGMWSGNYANWQEVSTIATGYNAELILEKCKTALLKVKNGEAVYERDSVLFDSIQHNWALLAILLKISVENGGELRVLDFGGSLGSTYYQNRAFLSVTKSLQWCIVEQSNFVECGKQYFEDGQLTFYYTIEECIKAQMPHALLISSTLQYLENPSKLLDKIMDSGVEYLILDRLALCNETNNILTVQNVSSAFYEAKLGHWFFSKTALISKLSQQFELIAEAQSFAESFYLLNNNINCYFNLLIFKRR